MKKLKFKVITGIQNPILNKMLKCADLAEGVFVDDGSGYEITLTCKKAVNLEKAKDALKKAFEQFGFCVLRIVEI